MLVLFGSGDKHPENDRDRRRRLRPRAVKVVHGKGSSRVDVKVTDLMG